MIRLATPADAARVAAVYRPGVEESAASFEEVAPEPEVMAQRIESTLATHPWIVAERAGRVTGYAYASPHHARAGYRWSVNVSVYVDAAHHRSGIGRALYTSLFAILRAQGFLNAYAGIAIPNEPSVGLHESMGFTPIGVYRGVGYKLGAWRDVGWWHLALAPLPAVPERPLPLPALLQRPEWQVCLDAGAALLTR